MTTLAGAFAGSSPDIVPAGQGALQVCRCFVDAAVAVAQRDRPRNRGVVVQCRSPAHAPSRLVIGAPGRSPRLDATPAGPTPSRPRHPARQPPASHDLRLITSTGKLSTSGSSRRRPDRQVARDPVRARPVQRLPPSSRSPGASPDGPRSRAAYRVEVPSGRTVPNNRSAGVSRFGQAPVGALAAVRVIQSPSALLPWHVSSWPVALGVPRQHLVSPRCVSRRSGCCSSSAPKYAASARLIFRLLSECRTLAVGSMGRLPGVARGPLLRAVAANVLSS